MSKDSSESHTSSKKKRNSNFSKDEVFCMVTEYGKRINVLNFGNREQKQLCWQEITKEINNLHPEFKRSIDEIKKKWIDLLYATKKEYVKATKEAASRGDKNRRKLSEISELIVKVRGGFSTSKSKSKNESNGSVHFINLQIPTTADGTEHPTTIYIPHVDECHSSASEAGTVNVNEGSVIIQDSFTTDIDVPQNEVSLVDGVTYENAYQTATASSPSHSRCICGLSADIVRLKQEALGVMRRRIQIEEERRLEEKQKWWEEKNILRLKRQKLELEIKQLQSSMKQVETPKTPNSKSH